MHPVPSALSDLDYASCWGDNNLHGMFGLYTTSGMMKACACPWLLLMVHLTVPYKLTFAFPIPVIVALIGWGLFIKSLLLLVKLVLAQLSTAM